MATPFGTCERPFANAGRRSPISVTLSSSSREWAQCAAEQFTPFIALATDAGWRTRRWPHSAAFTRLVRRRFGVHVCHLGSVEPVHQLGPLDMRGQIALSQAAALLEQAKLCVCVDSGLLHLAAALGVPTIALFGPTIPQLRVHPSQSFLTTRFGCAGCYHVARPAWRYCAREEEQGTEPGPFTPCMTDISAGSVIRKVEALWQDC
jgi:ADP-heptose:LPS heptosyltransferase